MGLKRIITLKSGVYALLVFCLCIYIVNLRRENIVLLHLGKAVGPAAMATEESPKFSRGFNTKVKVSNSSKLTRNSSLNVMPDSNPVILIWQPQFGSKVGYLANPEVCNEDIECEISYDKTKLKQAESLVFHFSSVSKSSMPKWRSPEQLYAWWTLERTHSGSLSDFDNFFNMTFSYRSDSDVYAPYGSIHLVLEEISKEGEPDVDTLLQRKRESGKMAIWAVNNCGVKRRMNLAADLEKNGVKVDKYGRCFQGQIGKGTYSKEFYDEISKYKFYFAFENGYHCKDYMTEKFWFNGLRSGAVPVVLGATKEDVLKVAPKNSFIHVDDFESPSKLAEYLKFLSENEDEYKKYLEWRNWVHSPELIEPHLHKEHRNNDLRSFCALCKILHQNREAERAGTLKYRNIVTSLRDWWWKKENRECLRS